MLKRRRGFFKTQRRAGEAITIAAGIGITLLGAILGVNFVAYGGLCIAGLGIASIVWR
ncbi:MAG TPA: hypothetical protein VJP79_11910 [Nitrososphaera sp.]|nr:hypothetical protein [Nitrososphaera sp.]